VEAVRGREGADLPPGRVVLTLAQESGRIVLEVRDNGKGLPRENRDRLTEPYVTTRAKGTGLGLAIVKKIMEDHGGDLYLEDAPGGGARVGVIFRTGEAANPATPSDQTAVHGA
ncbi:MAG TPA: ATP-binding protein, partial [Candidatus Omnitrophota bacterium]|nr:ATP-binding protein [Candidatus Omnitrophota bacterium]